MNHRITTVVAFVAVFGTVAVSPAEARSTCSEKGNLCRADVGSAASGSFVFAEPIAALGGRSLGQYLADHVAGDRRISGVTV